jgi:hypothetical protein
MPQKIFFMKELRSFRKKKRFSWEIKAKSLSNWWNHNSTFVLPSAIVVFYVCDKFLIIRSQLPFNKANFAVKSTSKIKIMSYEPIFALFWERVKQSITDKTYSKLTLAKTIGDTEIKNLCAPCSFRKWCVYAFAKYKI